jgi:hypothetical protein
VEQLVEGTNGGTTGGEHDWWRARLVESTTGGEHDWWRARIVESTRGGHDLCVVIIDVIA